MTGPTFIKGDQLDLRPPGEEDIPFLQAGVNHPDVRRYIGVFDTPYSEERYRDELWPIDRGDEGVTLLAVPTDHEECDGQIGSVQLYPIDESMGTANFGVWFHPSAWGNGYALEASAHLVEYGFDELRLHRVGAVVMAPNSDAGRLCDRLGFVPEGTDREAAFTDGRHVDVERYGLLERDWAGIGEVLD